MFYLLTLKLFRRQLIGTVSYIFRTRPEISSGIVAMQCRKI